MVLDEPTNDLDLLTLNKLEEFLDNFSGCLIIVSHDRYFMDKLVDHLFVFEGEGKVRDFWGPYSEWKAQKEEDEAAEKKNKVAKVEKKRVEQKVQSSSSDKAKLGFKEKYELEQLDKEVPLLEEQVASLQAKLGESSLPYEEIQDASEKLGLLTGELEEKMYRWMVLDERR